jgi:hypothetical protein
MITIEKASSKIPHIAIAPAVLNLKKDANTEPA